jgi:preprotein translocase subunit SecA
MERLGMEEGEPIEHNLISRAIENAQSKVEGHNFDIRKHLLEYDDVMNQQREVIYRQRRDLLTGESTSAIHHRGHHRRKAEEIAADFADERTPRRLGPQRPLDAVFKQFNFRIANLSMKDTLDGLTEEGLAQNIYEQAMAVYAKRKNPSGGHLRHLERDGDAPDRGQPLEGPPAEHGPPQRGHRPARLRPAEPLIVYKKEGFEMFQGLIERIKEETIAIMFRIQLAEPQSFQQMQKAQNQESDLLRRRQPARPRNR